MNYQLITKYLLQHGFIEQKHMQTFVQKTFESSAIAFFFEQDCIIRGENTKTIC